MEIKWETTKNFPFTRYRVNQRTFLLCCAYGGKKTTTTYENGNCQMENDEKFSSLRFSWTLQGLKLKLNFNITKEDEMSRKKKLKTVIVCNVTNSQNSNDVSVQAYCLTGWNKKAITVINSIQATQSNVLEVTYYVSSLSQDRRHVMSDNLCIESFLYFIGLHEKSFPIFDFFFFFLRTFAALRAKVKYSYS